MRWQTPLAAAFLASVTMGVFGCAPTFKVTSPSPAPASLQTAQAAPACIPLVNYTPAQQKALSDALRSLPPGSPLASAMVDYERMRDADRACLAIP